METLRSTRIGTPQDCCSPFGGIPRNWKRYFKATPKERAQRIIVPPSGGSLEIGNEGASAPRGRITQARSPFGGIPRNWKLKPPSFNDSLSASRSPFGGIPRNWKQYGHRFVKRVHLRVVPPSGGSLEIGNMITSLCLGETTPSSPFGGIPRNWKHEMEYLFPNRIELFPLRGDP